MIIYPAIDIRSGRVVRLREGDPQRQVVFSQDPVETAERWLEQGAAWLHIVNLDGALQEANDTLSVLDRIVNRGAAVQFGGGIRSLDDAQKAFDRGVDRVVFGTAAIDNPELMQAAVVRFGSNRVCVALDARNGKVATHGWTKTTDLNPVEIGRRFQELGVIHALYTDINRDGGMQGVNVEATARLAAVTGLQVIASGGISSIDDLRQLHATGQIAGAVIGMALYEGNIRLSDALSLVKGI